MKELDAVHRSLLAVACCPLGRGEWQEQGDVEMMPLVVWRRLGTRIASNLYGHVLEIKPSADNMAHRGCLWPKMQQAHHALDAGHEPEYHHMSTIA